ncbi:MAG: hypothetical protein CMB99_00695 [Flavobacteriaceae bacterium]|nr:hypothetical protein [Flavobacteriaceae bacterium]
MTQFTRSLGNESGVQLNPLQDESAVPTVSNADRVIATVMRCGRGPVNKPFAVSRGSFKQKVGRGERVRTNPLNESYVQAYESLQNGASGLVIQRLVSVAEAQIGWAYASIASDDFTFDVTDKEVAITSDPNVVGGTTLEKDSSAVSGYLVAVKHLDCHNDGIMLEIHADEVLDGSFSPVANDVITLRILDSTGAKLLEFTGSTDPDATDAAGNSTYLVDVVESQTDRIEIQVVSQSVPASHDCYGYDSAGNKKWVRSGVLKTFEEVSGSFAGYVADDYQHATSSLMDTDMQFGYLSTSGAQASQLISGLTNVSHERNVPVAVDVPGNLTADAAAQWVASMGLSSSTSNHLVWAFWAPLMTDCPAGINPRGYFGTSMFNLARACARNAVKNSYGFAAKNYPIAGVDHPLNRTNMVQKQFPKASDLDRLAKSRVNPVIFETFSDRSTVVFRDSLTSAPENSLKKLISVADMSSTMDDMVTRFAKQALQKPMSVAIDQTEKYLRDLFERAENSGWLVPSAEPEMDGRSFQFAVFADPENPHDKMKYQYKLRYDGTSRQVEVTQTLSR